MKKQVLKLLADLVQDEEGAQLVEYILVTALIAIASMIGMNFLGKASDNHMNNLGVTLQ